MNESSSSARPALRIEPVEKDLGGFSVRRILPAARRRAVGPFVFFDHMGPAEFGPGEGIDVRPHPHIGLATITFLFDGAIVHRDSLGYTQSIEPGAVNLMTAGRGIVHSERSGDDRARTSRLHGIQSWMALPESLQEIEPAFEHFPADALPVCKSQGVSVTVIIGEFAGMASPVGVHADMIYLDVHLEAGARFSAPDGHDELAIYVVSGEVEVDGAACSPGVMAVGADGTPPECHARCDAHVMLIGGENMGRRTVWWNFVSTSRERIEQAKDDWREQRFGAVPGETEFIPLPDPQK